MQAGSIRASGLSRRIQIWAAFPLTNVLAVFALLFVLLPSAEAADCKDPQVPNQIVLCADWKPEFSNVDVRAVLKSDKDSKIGISFESRDQEIRLAFTKGTKVDRKDSGWVAYPDERGNAVYLRLGLKATDGGWIDFLLIDYIAIERVQKTDGGGFDGFQTRLKLRWTEKRASDDKAGYMPWEITDDGAGTQQWHGIEKPVQIGTGPRLIGHHIEFHDVNKDTPVVTISGKVSLRVSLNNVTRNEPPVNVEDEIRLPLGSKIVNCELSPSVDKKVKSCAGEWLPGREYEPLKIILNPPPCNWDQQLNEKSAKCEPLTECPVLLERTEANPVCHPMPACPSRLLERTEANPVCHPMPACPSRLDERTEVNPACHPMPACPSRLDERTEANPGCHPMPPCSSRLLERTEANPACHPMPACPSRLDERTEANPGCHPMPPCSSRLDERTEDNPVCHPMPECPSLFDERTDENPACHPRPPCSDGFYRPAPNRPCEVKKECVGVSPLTRNSEGGVTMRLALNTEDDFTRETAFVVFKNGKEEKIVSKRVTGAKISELNTFRNEATRGDLDSGHFVKEFTETAAKCAVIGLKSDIDQQWHSLDEVDRIVVKRSLETLDNTFNGYHFEFRVPWKDGEPGNWEIEDLGAKGKTVPLSEIVNAQPAPRILGRKIEFRLESVDGPVMREAEKEQIVLIAGAGVEKTVAGNSELILEMRSQVTGCRMADNSALRYTVDPKSCNGGWLKTEDGPLRVVLKGLSNIFKVSYSRDGSKDGPQLSAMTVFLTTGANGPLNQVREIRSAGNDAIEFEGSLSATHVKVNLAGDPNFEDMNLSVFPLGQPIKLLKRRSGALILFEANNRMDTIRDAAVSQLIKAVDALKADPIGQPDASGKTKLVVGVASEEEYMTIGDLKVAEFFSSYRMSDTAVSAPREVLPNAQKDLPPAFGGAGAKSRLVWVIPSDAVLTRPWPADPPFDPNKFDLYVVEVSTGNTTPRSEDFMKQFFAKYGQDASVRYRFIRNFREDLEKAIVGAVLN